MSRGSRLRKTSVGDEHLMKLHDAQYVLVRRYMLLLFKMVKNVSFMTVSSSVIWVWSKVIQTTTKCNFVRLNDQIKSIHQVLWFREVYPNLALYFLFPGIPMDVTRNLELPQETLQLHIHMHLYTIIKYYGAACHPLMSWEQHRREFKLNIYRKFSRQTSSTKTLSEAIKEAWK